MSANLWKLEALLKKNMLEMKRNFKSTICEIFFPIILMLLLYWIKSIFDITTITFDDAEKGLDTYIKTKSSSIIDFQNANISSSWYGLSILPMLKICSPLNSKLKSRPAIATIGIPEIIKQKMKNDSEPFKSQIGYSIDSLNFFKDFNSVDEMESYIKSNLYGESSDYPLLCFGMRLEEDKVQHKYNYSLHYFENDNSDGAQDVPKSLYLVNTFQTAPDLSSYEKYQTNGYPYVMKLISDYILSQESDNNKDAKINFGILPMKYDDYKIDLFGTLVSYMCPFFIVIAYMGHVCIYVYRMVVEKETKCKEGMKIMGLTEGIYFLSYFLQYCFISIIDSVINAYIFKYTFTRIPYLVFFFVFFLFSLNVFALAFFFQSFIDKSKESLIISLLLYFIMYCLSMLTTDDNASHLLKVILSVFPPVTVSLGVTLLGQFQINFKDFYYKDIMYSFNNYSVFTMFAMMIFNLVLYLFLGYYLQNVLPHDFGVRKPWHFIFTQFFKSKKNGANISKYRNMPINKIENNLQNSDNININNNNTALFQTENKNGNFQSEELYKDYTNPGDKFEIHQLVKKFDDGKIAVNHVDLNLYKNEIFALLGHNGAGKTTLISILTGLYEATDGEALYEGMNILDPANIDTFREKIGICPQHDVLFNDLDVREHLSMFSLFKGVSSSSVQNEINKIIHDFQLEDVQNTLAKNLSAGQRRKLSIAISLVGGSQIIFLDEPSSGMDITSRRNLWEILKRQSENKIIILTTHYMEEASILGQRIGIMNLGKMKCIGTPLFLIEKFGKFMSLTLEKEEGADNNTITDFIQKIFNDSQFESLSEEIIVRIPIKSFNNGENGCSLNKFLELLDSNLQNLKIKSYNVSMPTLEDVFLNVAVEDEDNKNAIKIKTSKEEDDKILLNSNYMDNFQTTSKFKSDFIANFYRRLKLTLRDKKGLIVEVFCPILLVLIGSILSKVNTFYTSPSFTSKDVSTLGKQTIFYGMFDKASQNISKYFINDYKNISSKYLNSFDNYIDTIGNNHTLAMEYFIENIFNESHNSNLENLNNVYGSLLLLNEPNENNKNYEFVEIVNPKLTFGVPIYTAAFLESIIKKEVNHDISINFMNKVMPKTAKQEMSTADKNTAASLFIAIAFSLIPANFISIIIKERINNSKHLMRLAGINIFSYWSCNFLFEMIKYYFTGGLCMILLYIFDNYTDYLLLFYLLYGPPLILFTYFVSYFFDDESNAQNKMILLHSLIGSLGSTVIIVLRQLASSRKTGKILQYIFCLIPSFCFNFGYNLSLNRLSIYMSDYPNEWFLFKDDVLIKKFNLLMGPLVYLEGEIIVYGLIILIIEYFSYNSFLKPNENYIDEGHSSAKDSGVVNEEIRARQNIKTVNNNNIIINNINNINTNNNKDEDINSMSEKLLMGDINSNSNSSSSGVKNINSNINSNNINNINNNFAVRVKNLRRVYTTTLLERIFYSCCRKGKVAVRNLNFCVERGECFGLLGLNGAGKTTTFKCITQELNPSGGSIFINGENSHNRFNDFKNVFGYCPQYDAIFEYLTVFENLEFYAKIKGVKPEFISQIVNILITEMRLDEFTNKISGRLSGGNKRKLSVAIAMLCSPPIILLDEPSTGMDPEARRFMWSIIHKLSTSGKKSAIIMTTHSMDEAETLCKRMGIMVNGEFVCLGKASEIKNKYGYGYELNVRIKPMTQIQQNQLFFEKFDKISQNLRVTKQNVSEILETIGKKEFDSELQNGRLGEKIIKDISKGNGINISSLLNWVFFVENALKFIRCGKDNFANVIIEEHMDNSFLFKMKKKENDNNSIGYLFGLFEVHKDECFITEYSLQQTSLEQIFNKFSQNQMSLLATRRSTIVEDGDVENIAMSNLEMKKLSKNGKIVVTDELLDTLLK